MILINSINTATLSSNSIECWMLHDIQNLLHIETCFVHLNVEFIIIIIIIKNIIPSVGAISFFMNEYVLKIRDMLKILDITFS